VALDETRIFPLTAGGEGWVTQVLSGTTGSTVQKGQPLVSVYGREYTSAQRTFLYALRASQYSPPPPPQDDYQDLASVAAQEARITLQNMGFADAQIDRIAKARQVMLDIPLAAPAAGVIVARNVFPKQKFERGTELFRIADLSHVWIIADLFGDDAGYIHGGDTALVSLPDRPGIKLRARVAQALASFDGRSRTLKLRLEADNPKLILRPDMFVDLEFRTRLPKAITVPTAAVVETGSRKAVFVDLGEGKFEAREVETGWRSGDRVQIVSGLRPGESIVVSGNFLLDSETRMRKDDSRGHD
jgi:RND family efflux transporter MFP subunit